MFFPHQHRLFIASYPCSSSYLFPSFPPVDFAAFISLCSCSFLLKIHSTPLFVPCFVTLVSLMICRPEGLWRRSLHLFGSNRHNDDCLQHLFKHCHQCESASCDILIAHVSSSPKLALFSRTSTSSYSLLPSYSSSLTASSSFSSLDLTALTSLYSFSSLLKYHPLLFRLLFVTFKYPDFSSLRAMAAVSLSIRHRPPQ